MQIPNVLCEIPAFGNQSPMLNSMFHGFTQCSALDFCSPRGPSVVRVSSNVKNWKSKIGDSFDHCQKIQNQLQHTNPNTKSDKRKFIPNLCYAISHIIFRHRRRNVKHPNAVAFDRVISPTLLYNTLPSTSLPHFYNTLLQRFSTALVCKTSLQHHSALLCTKLLQRFSTTLFSNASLQQLSATPFQNNSPQRSLQPTLPRSSPTLPFNTSLQHPSPAMWNVHQDIINSLRLQQFGDSPIECNWRTLTMHLTIHCEPLRAVAVPTTKSANSTQYYPQTPNYNREPFATHWGQKNAQKSESLSQVGTRVAQLRASRCPQLFLQFLVSKTLKWFPRWWLMDLADVPVVALMLLVLCLLFLLLF